jgi:hypothetical protein
MHKLIFDLFKNDPKYIKIIPLEISDNIDYNNIIEIWNYFKQSDPNYINKYGNFEKLFDKVFNINGKKYNDKVNNYNINKNLNIYKKYLENISFLKDLFKTHTNIDNVNMMIVISVKNSDDIFVNFKSDKCWRLKILLNMRRKNMKEVFNGIKNGPFWTYKLKYNRIDESIKDILWKNQIFTKNYISISIFSK